MAHAAAQGGHHAHDHDHDHDHEVAQNVRILDISNHGLYFIRILICDLYGTSSKYERRTNSGRIVQMPGIIAETFILLTSSFTSGLAVLGMNKGNRSS